MTDRPFRRGLGAALLAAVVALTTACAANPTLPTGTPGGEQPAPGGPSQPAETPDPQQTIGPVDPESVDCDTLLEADLVSELTDRGWTPREDPFFIGDVELTDGISCTWGDFTAETGDNLLLFAWSPITAAQTTAAMTTLRSEGWNVEEGADGVYVTEDPEQAIAVDDDGYGITYLFGDGWVTLSDTRQGLVLIQRPGVQS